MLKKEKLDAVLFGASSPAHILETKELLETGLNYNNEYLD